MCGREIGNHDAPNASTTTLPRKLPEETVSPFSERKEKPVAAAAGRVAGANIKATESIKAVKIRGNLIIFSPFEVAIAERFITNNWMNGKGCRLDAWQKGFMR